MPNHYYIISEVQFFNDKEDVNTRNFVSCTGIDLNEPCSSRMPTLSEIKRALVELGLETKERHYNDNCVEVVAIKESDIGFWLIFTNIENESIPINMFEAGRGSDPELTIDFVKFLTMTHGNFLYYFDGGKMSLITASKDKQTIMKHASLLVQTKAAQIQKTVKNSLKSMFNHLKLLSPFQYTVSCRTSTKNIFC